MMINSHKAIPIVCGALLLGAGAYWLSKPSSDTEVAFQAPVVSEVKTDEAAMDAATLPIRESVLQLVGLSGDGSVSSRRAAIAELPKDLNAKELESIYQSVLRQETPEGMNVRAWHAIFNDTLNKLVLDQNQPLLKLPQELFSVLGDESRHRVLRDYSLQHILAYAEFCLDGDQRLELLDQAWDEIQQTRDSYRGTYLAAVYHNCGASNWPAPADVVEKAWAIANSEDAHVLSRITALQVCGKLGYREALPLACDIAADPDAHMTLRTSAIATVGDLGGEEEQMFLESLFTELPPRLRIAASAASERIHF